MEEVDKWSNPLQEWFVGNLSYEALDEAKLDQELGERTAAIEADLSDDEFYAEFERLFDHQVKDIFQDLND